MVCRPPVSADRSRRIGLFSCRLPAPFAAPERDPPRWNAGTGNGPAPRALRMPGAQNEDFTAGFIFLYDLLQNRLNHF